ncbi:MAG: large subunit ribosomal protein L22 [Pseudoalteromonas tetraodonis]|jgi:large subunit ribosomal protein L22
MEVKSLYKYARVSPLKARDVAREIQGLPVSAALDILNFTPRKAAFLIGKTLKSAIANAENNHELDIESLVVKEATATDGPSFRRFKARARGSGAPIKRRTSHLQIILTDEIEIETRESKKKSKGKGKKKPAPKKEQPKVEKAEAAPAAEEPEIELVVEETPATDAAPATDTAPAAEEQDTKE